MDNKKGVSFVILAFTIVLLIVLLGVTTVGISNSIENSRKSAFASDLVSLEDAINIYFIQNGELPILSESGNYVEYGYNNGSFFDKSDISNAISITNGTDIETEMQLNGDLSQEVTDTVYYKLDLAKINVEKIKRGNGTSPDDIYMIAYPSQNLYYIKGLNIGDEIYYSLVNLMDIVGIRNNQTESTDRTQILETIAGMNIKRDKKLWTNTVDLVIDAYLESQESIYAIIPQAGSTIERQFQTTLGQNVINIKNLKNSLSLSDTEFNSFNSLQQSSKYIIIEKRRGDTKIGSIKVNLSNFETEVPKFPLKSDGITYDFNITSNPEQNVVSFKAIDNISGVSQVKYLEYTKFDENGNIKNMFKDANGNNIATFTPEYMSQNGKSAKVSKDGFTQINLPKDVESIYITVFDKAGNSVSMQKNVQPKIYAGINILNISSNLKIGYVIKSNSSISSAKVYTSTDGNQYTEHSSLALTDNGNNIYTSSNDIEKQDNLYIKLMVKNSENETETVIKKMDLSEKSYEMINTALPGIIYTENRYFTDKNGDKAIVPVGFKVSSKSDEQTIDDGLVIIDKYDNEFVWIPVDGTNVTYVKNFTYPSNYSASSSDTSDVPEELPTGVKEETQISKYGGFYIGRYEAGVPANQTAIDGASKASSDTTGKPQSKSGVTVWTNISYTNANSNAKNFCNTDYVKSGLLTGTSWDTVCKWIDNSGKSVTDSTTWGNHNDSQSPANVTGYGQKKTSGYSDYWKAKNIYDFAGNVWEWTNEARYINRVNRGGYYGVSGSSHPASCRNNLNPSNTYYSIGFRLQLYIM